MNVTRTIDRYDHFVNGILIGGGLMYLFDPDRGRRRRAKLRDRGHHLVNRADDASGVTARDLRNRTIGALAEVRSRFQGDGAPDRVVEGRVRSQLGRLASNPGAITVNVVGGTATLRGPVRSDEVDRVVDGVRHAQGVRDVNDELSVHEHSEQIPGLQGGSRKPKNRPELLQENWAPATRFVAGSVGAAMLARGMAVRGPIRGLLTATGLGLLSRAATNLQFRRLTGVGAGRRAIDLHKIVTINAPIEDIYHFWSDFENLPLFMEHVEEVRNTGGGRSHWTARGPGGVPVSWEAELSAFREGEVIGWKSIGASPVRHTGIVRFQPVGEGATRVDLRMSYNPPGGAIGHAVAAFFGSDPKRALEEDLVRLKSLFEEGKTTVRHRDVTLREQGKHLPVESGS